MKWIVITLLLLFTLTLEGHAYAQGFSPPELTLSVQQARDTARVTARWYYNPPQNWTIQYEHWLVDGTTELWRDTTGTQVVNFDVAKTDVDLQRTFCVRILRLEPSPKPGAETCQTFVIPARVPYLALVDTTTTTPTVIPHTPDMEHDQGTLWVELTPSTIERAGIFSKDHTGYGGVGLGGHFSLEMLADGTVTLRIQGDTMTVINIQGGQLVQGDLNQIAVEYGTGGANLWVNGVIVASDPNEGSTRGNLEALVIGASAQNDQSLPGEPKTYQLPFDGTIRTEWYDGDYDFSDRWQDSIPLPPPPPVDSLVIEVASIHSIGVHNTPNEAVWMHITPILEAREIVTYVNGVEHRRRDARIAPIDHPWVGLRSTSWQTGEWEQEYYNPNTGAKCINRSWGNSGTDCFNRNQQYTAVRRKPCDDPFMTCPVPESATLA